MLKVLFAASAAEKTEYKIINDEPVVIMRRAEGRDMLKHDEPFSSHNQRINKTN